MEKCSSKLRFLKALGVFSDRAFYLKRLVLQC